MGIWGPKHKTSDTTKGMSDAEKKTARINEAKKARNTKIIRTSGKDSGQGKGNR